MRIFVYEHVTAGGLGAEVPASLQSEGRAMLDAVVADFRRIAGVEVHSDCAADGFRAQSALSDWTLVIAPEFDNFLHDLSRAVLEAGGRLLGSTPDTIRLTADKLAMARFWHAHGVAHPATKSDVTSMPTPCVLKPRFGAGSQATYLIRDETESKSAWQTAQAEWSGEFIAQTHVAGQAASVALLVSESQTLVLLPARQQLSDDGRFRYFGGSIPLPEPLTGRAIDIALRAIAGIDGLRGYVGVDVVLGNDGVDYAIEINPRLTTSYLGLRQLCQQNLAELMLRMAQGETIDAVTWHSGAVSWQARVGM